MMCMSNCDLEMRFKKLACVGDWAALRFSLEGSFWTNHLHDKKSSIYVQHTV